VDRVGRGPRRDDLADLVADESCRRVELCRPTVEAPIGKAGAMRPAGLRHVSLMPPVVEVTEAFSVDVPGPYRALTA
jgi:hypothetical protein